MVPSLYPFFTFLAKCLKVLILPVPWPVLLFDLSDQLSAAARSDAFQALTSAHLARGVASRRAPLLLLVPVLLATVTTKRVGFVAPLSLGLRTFGLKSEEKA